MADDTPDASTPAATPPARKPAAKKAAATRKPAAKKTPATSAPAASAAAPSVPANSAEPAASAAAGSAASPTASAAVEPVAATPAAPPVAPTPVAATPPRATPAQRRSFLEGVRSNRMGALTAGLVVALVLALLLSILVPNRPGALAMTVLGGMIAAAVGFTVRYLATRRGLRTQVQAFVAALLGVHVMAITGVATIDLPLLSELGVEAGSFDQALLAAFAAPPVSAGGVLAGLAAAIIAGWGERSDSTHRA